jgi:hypothetical protein
LCFLSFFDWQILITLLVSSNSSCTRDMKMHTVIIVISFYNVDEYSVLTMLI